MVMRLLELQEHRQVFQVSEYTNMKYTSNGGKDVEY